MWFLFPFVYSANLPSRHVGMYMCNVSIQLPKFIILSFPMSLTVSILHCTCRPDDSTLFPFIPIWCVFVFLCLCVEVILQTIAYPKTNTYSRIQKMTERLEDNPVNLRRRNNPKHETTHHTGIRCKQCTHETIHQCTLSQPVRGM